MGELVKAYYESDEVIAHFLDSRYFDRFVWHTQFCFTDNTGKNTKDETSYLIELAAVKQGQTILDFGCGAGYLCRKLAMGKKACCYGVNISDKQIAIAQQETLQNGLTKLVHYNTYDGSRLPYPEDFFDRIFFQESMCHVPDKLKIFREFFRVLKPGGYTTGQDWFSLKEGSPYIQKIDEKFCTFLATQKAYAALAGEAGFIETHAIDCADLTRSDHYKKFGGTFKEAIDCGHFTIGFFLCKKPDL